ncbi:hypothetical protein GY632_2295 [Trichophyton interdigitale]|uniref:Amine oxidase n=1 Tax=Trichophyton interdigitale TaxID=101480 RepID=A0A9P5CZW8_9EURO|nr:hypothetical protein GY632_2295 [Trichophyton interdigitale]
MHPFDPLSTSEIDAAVAIVREAHDGPLKFNTVTLSEPRKAQMMAWLEDSENTPKPHRAAEVVAITPDGKLYDGIVDLKTNAIVEWNLVAGVQPLVTMEDLQFVEHMARKDESIIKQCEAIGIPREDMHKVYCDPWTIGYDERFGNSDRLQQALMYYRPDIDDYMLFMLLSIRMTKFTLLDGMSLKPQANHLMAFRPGSQIQQMSPLTIPI